MFCKNCGAEISDNAVVCMKCGVLVGDGDKYCPTCGAEPDPKAVICVKCGCALKSFQSPIKKQKQVRDNKNVHTFKEAVAICLNKYADFTGRACRAEYWYWGLLMFLAFIAYWGLANITMGNIITYSYNENTFGTVTIIYWIWCLAMLLPSLAVTVRRLHDIGKSGWWYFIALIPIIGGILLLIWMCQDGEPNANEYGTNPKNV